MILEIQNKKNIESTKIIFSCLIKILFPSIIFFLIIWQSVEHAHLVRQIKKLNSKKDD